MGEQVFPETYDLWNRDTLLPSAACAVHFPFNSPKRQDILAIPPISQRGKLRLEEANGLILLSTEVAVWQCEATLSNSGVHVLSTIRQGYKHIVQIQ